VEELLVLVGVVDVIVWMPAHLQGQCRIAGEAVLGGAAQGKGGGEEGALITPSLAISNPKVQHQYRFGSNLIRAEEWRQKSGA
jgi:hypothetical protein